MIFIMGASHLEKLFDEKHYQDLEGGLLEGLGKLLANESRIYIYPHKTETTCMTAKTFFPSPKWAPIFQYFLQQKQIMDISGCDQTEEYRHSDYVRELILKKDPAWEKYVPAKIRDQIKKDNLFNLYNP